MMTARFLSNRRISDRFHDAGLSSVAIASLFWCDSREGRRVSQIVKFITLVSMFSILWLEFASLARLASSAFGIDSLLFRSAFLFASVVFVVDFTVRNGLRGFMFADLLLAPLILVGATGVLFGVYIHGTPNITRLAAYPQIPTLDVIVFCVATVFLNSFIIICSEGHWLRSWSMPDHILARTTRSGALTGLIWLLLVVTGLFAFGSLSHSVGVIGVIEIIGSLTSYSIWYGVFFWIGATSAILSTADGQLYAGLVLLSFSTQSGTVEPGSKIITKPLLFAILCASIFTLLFLFVESSGFPFDQILFFVLPFFLCIAPAFVQTLTSGRSSAVPLTISAGLYIICGLIMIIVPTQYSLILSLSAPLMPMLVCIFLLFRRSQ